MNTTLQKWLVGDLAGMKRRLARGFWHFCLVWGCGVVGGLCALLYVLGYAFRLPSFDEMGWRQILWMVVYWVGPAGFCLGAMMFAVSKLSLRIFGRADSRKADS